MAQLEPKDFNKPCLMTYGEIAERLAFWSELVLTQDARAMDGGDLGWLGRGVTETASEWALRVSGGLLKLSTEDVR